MKMHTLELPRAASPDEVAAALGVSRATVLRWLSGGELPASKVRDRLLIEIAAVAEMLEQNRVQRRAER